MSQDKTHKDSTSSGRSGARRRAVKTLVIGGSAVSLSKWTTPVVDSVILPAHAQTSPSGGSRNRGGGGGTSSSSFFDA